MLYHRAHLLFQGLHGHVLNALPLDPDPVGFIGDQEGQDELNYNQCMLQKKVQTVKTDCFPRASSPCLYLHHDRQQQNVGTAHLALLIQLP